MRITRRSFVAAGAAVLAADPLGMPVGTQVYPVRDALGKDFEGTLRNLAAMGYRTIEMCSPQGYKSSFTPLASMKASEVRAKIQDAGLTCESSHYVFRELKENLAERIAYAKELGLKQMILASFSIREGSALTDWARAAGELNKIAVQIKAAGLQTGFHNHDGEFKQIDGKLIYDTIMSELDPGLVKMQYQVATGRLGFDAAALFKKYKGRFLSLHLQDWTPADKKMVAIGSGAVDWKTLFASAEEAGVRNYFVEVDPGLMKDSYTYLHGLRV